MDQRRFKKETMLKINEFDVSRNVNEMAYKDGQFPMYLYTEEEKQEIRKEYGLKNSTMEDDIDAIIEWFKKQPHLIEAGIDRDLIERMMILNRGSVEKTKTRIDNFYKHRGIAPEILQTREKVLRGERPIWTFYRQSPMPKLFKGKRITVLQFVDPDPSTFSTEELFRNILMLGDLRLKYDYLLGDIWIIDLKNTSLGHLFRINPSLFQKGAQLFQEGMGVKVYGIHLVNAPGMWTQALNYLKQFVKPKMVERTMTHETLEELHQHIPKQYLPKDYGGDEPSMEELRDKYETLMRSEPVKQYLLDRRSVVSNESLRPGGKINEDFLAGSFKKLDFD